MKQAILLPLLFLLLHGQAQEGTLDPTFGNGGFYMEPPSSVSRIVTNEGKLVSVTETNSGFEIKRYNPDGSPDASFGNNGVVASNFIVHDDVGPFLIQSDGKIVVAGTTVGGTVIPLSNQFYFAVARYNYDGTRDLSFGVNGLVLIIARTNHGDGNLRDMFLSATDKIVMEGEFAHPGGVSTILYFLDSGKSYGLVGPPTFSSTISFTYGGPVAVSNSGKVVAEGYQEDAVPVPEYFLNLFQSNGTRDLSFGSNGIVVLDGQVEHLAFQNELKFIASTGNKLIRLNLDGSEDASFGVNGLVNTPFPVASLIVQNNEKIIIGGGLNGDFALARYNPDGSLDKTFGTNGITISDFGGSESLAQLKIGAKDLYAYGSDILAAYRLNATTPPCSPPTFLNNQQIVLDASCNGSDGNISIIPQTGKAPYQYSIDGGATYVQGPDAGYTFQHLAAGTYQLRLKDAGGCESKIVTRQVKNVYGTPAFLNNQQIVLDASCKGNDGNISIIPTCGMAPFQYSINGGATYVQGPDAGYTFQHLAAGTYQLRLKDGAGHESSVITREVKANAFGPCVVTVANPGLRSAAAEESTEVRAYPNPSQGQFQVQLRRFGAERVQVQILDARGGVVQTRTVNARETNTVDINLSGKAKGFYLIRVVSQKGMQVQKAMVQ